jgi:hypothetical protein
MGTEVNKKDRFLNSDFLLMNQCHSLIIFLLNLLRKLKLLHGGDRDELMTFTA